MPPRIGRISLLSLPDNAYLARPLGRGRPAVSVLVHLPIRYEKGQPVPVIDRHPLNRIAYAHGELGGSLRDFPWVEPVPGLNGRFTFYGVNRRTNQSERRPF